MKTPIKNHLYSAAIMFAAVLSACTNTKTNNASYAADSANKAQIATTDTARIDSIASADSNNRKAENTAYAAVKKKKELMKDESEFLVKSYEGSMFEIELAESAGIHASNAEIKKLAAQLVTAHKAFNIQMLNIAFNASYKLPGGVDSNHAKDLTNLEKQKGTDYDKKFLDMIVSAHEKSVEAYTGAAKKLADGETKTYATQTLPKIQNHLEIAKKLKDQLK